jgi:hypothetical protein
MVESVASSRLPGVGTSSRLPDTEDTACWLDIRLAISPVGDGLPQSYRIERAADGMIGVSGHDAYSFRWGDPEFARAFIKAMPPAVKVCGFYLGPDLAPG